MKRRFIIFGAALVLHFVLMIIVAEISDRQARKNTEWQLDYSVLDLHDTVAGAIDTMLGHVARTAVRHIGSAQPIPMERMAAGAKELDIDEINVVNREGRIIASNDPYCMGVVMAGDPVMDEFMQLTNGTVATVSQPFRPHARNPKFRAKYLAAAFPGGNGFVQVGLDERRLYGMLPSILGYIFDEWLLGRTGFFLCSDIESGKLISNPSRHRDEAHSLAGSGYDVAAAAEYEFVADGKSYGKTFVQKLFGEKCYCRAFVFGGHRFVAALPEREFYDTRNMLATIFGAVLFLVIASIAFFLDRIFRDSDRIKAYYKAEDARRAKDMAIAANIQESAIPRMFPPYSEERRMDIFASMHTAKDVGGDFYDFYFTGPNRFSFLVADVSGKGVPAALFMMRAKTTIKGIAQTGLPLAETIAKVNDALSHDNDANMFVTIWIGELDLDNGTLKYVNAGHNPPLLIKRDGKRYAEPSFVHDRSGMIVGAMPGLKFREYTLHLAPGDLLYLYTDGITEQPDAKGELFGEERLAFSVSEMLSSGVKPIDGGSSHLLTALFAAVMAHGAGTEQADDCTQLVITYNGPMLACKFPPNQDGVASASAWLDAVVKAPQGDMAKLHIMLDEICSNIVKHSGATGFEIDIEIAEEPRSVKITFIDDGVAYDPLSHVDPDITLRAEARPIGGLGILMVKKMASSVSYRRAGDHNRFTIVHVMKGK